MTRLAAALIAALIAAPALAEDEPTEDEGKRVCFRTSEIINWRALDEQTVRVEVSVNDFYELKLVHRCTGIRFREAVAFEGRPSGFFCDGPSGYVQTSFQRCPVASISVVDRLTPKRKADETEEAASEDAPASEG